MLVPIEITPATIVLLGVVIVAIVFVVRRLVTRGMCDCHDHCGDSAKPGSGGCHGCNGCSAAANMVANMEASMNDVGGSGEGNK